MEIWPGKWVARVRDLASEPQSLTEARKAAVDLYRCKDRDKPADWIDRVNRQEATVLDRQVIERQRRQWPLNVMGANNRQAPRMKVDAKAVLTETVRIDERVPGVLQDDNYPLEYYENGYPKLPVCLDRRSLPAMAKAA